MEEHYKLTTQDKNHPHKVEPTEQQEEAAATEDPQLHLSKITVEKNTLPLLEISHSKQTRTPLPIYSRHAEELLKSDSLKTETLAS
jgi:hypothetical protein